MSTLELIKKFIYEINAPSILRSIYDLFTESLKKFARDDGTYLAAGMSYSIFFSVFPFILGLLAFLGIFFGHDYLDAQLNTFLGQCPALNFPCD